MKSKTIITTMVAVVFVASIAAIGNFAQPAAAAPPTTSMTFGTDSDDLMVTNGNNMWVLDADTGSAYHELLKGPNAGKQNSISIASFLQVWYDATDETPATTDQFATYSCHGTGSTTWLTGDDMITRYVSYFDGLVISFEAPDDAVQSGEAGYAIQGQNGPTDWAAGHTQIREFQLKTLMGIGVYSLEWTHFLDTSIGSISESGPNTRILLGADTASGYNLTNCGPNDPVKSPNTIRWIVNTLDII